MNIWIIAELILVFCIMWFCVDYMSYLAKLYLQPRGFNIDNVYFIKLGITDEGQKIIDLADEAETDNLLDDFWTIFERIKRYPGVEYASVSDASVPYSGSYMSRSFFIDTIRDYMQIKSVSREFFDIYKIKIEKGRVFDWDSPNEVVISGDENNLLLKHNVIELDTINYGEARDESNRLMKVAGVANKSKRSEFDWYNNIVYLPLSKHDKRIIDYVNYTEISVRLKPETDKNFVEEFSRNMQDQISVGPFFLTSVQSLSAGRDEYMIWQDFDNNIKSIFSISLFIFINIFLAIIGTFWFRIQARRGEIGLRMALGSSKTNIKKLFIGETFLLLFLSSIIATFICINISVVNILSLIGVPLAERETGIITQYFINYIFTFLLLSLILFFAVWYPAKRASKIQSAIALRDE